MATYVYLMGAARPSGKIVNVKVGVTNNLSRRQTDLATGCPNRICLLYAWIVEDRLQAFRNESRILNDCRGMRLSGEWFSGYDRRKVLTHAIRQLGQPSRIGSAAIPADLDAATKDAQARGRKKEFDRPKYRVEKRRQRKWHAKRRNVFAEKSGPCVILYSRDNPDEESPAYLGV